MSEARRRRAAIVVVLGLISALGVPLPAQQQPAQPQDEEFARLVKEWTTGSGVHQPARRSPARSRPASRRPRTCSGYYVGMPKKLTYTADIYRYYRALEGKTPRVKVTNIGTTDEGREILMVFVGSEDSIANLESYRSVSRAARRPARPDRRAGEGRHRPRQAHRT